MEAIQAFLKMYDQIPPKEKSMILLLAEKRFLKINQAVEEEQNQPEKIQELLLKLINDLEILNGIQLKQEEQAAKVSSQYWKPPIFYDDDDEESSIPLRDIIFELPLSVAITPDLPITDSLRMEDGHLNTIPETGSDEENESSVKNLNLTPSESEDLSDNEIECDVTVCDDSSPNFTTFSNPLFDSNDDFTSSQAGTLSQPSSSTVLPPPTSQPAPTESTTIPPTPVTEPTSEPSSPSTTPEHKTIEHPFEQPSPKHQQSSPRQEYDILQTQTPTHTYEAETRHMSVDDLFQLVPQLMTRIESLEKDLKQTK
ncbi:hypothetical protein Tco_0908142 [Tanacetum coccineum]|uniref:Uncharacterized protein n=1 Tax=Tanacetum coccineum TaxID=301880 RepID=A0ABQ5CN76_9ASTR